MLISSVIVFVCLFVLWKRPRHGLGFKVYLWVMKVGCKGSNSFGITKVNMTQHYLTNRVTADPKCGLIKCVSELFEYLLSDVVHCEEWMVRNLYPLRYIYFHTLSNEFHSYRESKWLLLIHDLKSSVLESINWFYLANSGIFRGLRPPLSQ